MDYKEIINIYKTCASKFCQENAKYNIIFLNELLDKLIDLLTDYKNNKITEELLLKNYTKFFMKKLKDFNKKNKAAECIVKNCNKEFTDLIKIITNYVDTNNNYYIMTSYIKRYFYKYDVKPEIDSIYKNLKTKPLTIKNIREIQKIIKNLLLKALEINKKKIIKYIKENKETIITTSLQLKSKLKQSF